jgi:hypothetical protein
VAPLRPARSAAELDEAVARALARVLVADYLNQNEQPSRRRNARAERPTDEPREPDSSIAESC